jgi:hypothetical protein
VNFENPVGTLNGPDRRPLYNVSDGLRINNNVINAILLSTDKGYFILLLLS